MFMLSNTLPRGTAKVHSTPADFAGYDEWAAALDLVAEQEPASTAACACYVDPAEFAALTSSDLAPAPTARDERGLELALAGAVRFGAGYFLVDGREGDRYAVRFDVEAGRSTCECGDWVWRIERALDEGAVPVDRACKHMYATEHAQARGLALAVTGGR